MFMNLLSNTAPIGHRRRDKRGLGLKLFRSWNSLRCPADAVFVVLLPNGLFVLHWNSPVEISVFHSAAVFSTTELYVTSFQLSPHVAILQCQPAVSNAWRIEPYATRGRHYSTRFHGASMPRWYMKFVQRNLKAIYFLFSHLLLSLFILMGSISNYLFIKARCLSCGELVLTWSPGRLGTR